MADWFLQRFSLEPAPGAGTTVTVRLSAASDHDGTGDTDAR